MKVRYIYSACIVVETSDLRICCDPWFSQGIYDGTWFQYPPVDDPITAIGAIQYVYISHIHPDHYDSTFLRKLLNANPECAVLVGSENQEFLVSKMLRDGFEPVRIQSLTIGDTQIAIFPNYAHSEINIDSALVVRAGKRSVVNLNDCQFDKSQVSEIKAFCEGSPDFACLPYAGAGPFPQMYEFDTPEDQLAASEGKKEQFLNLFGKYLEELQPRKAMPFAGLYYLGGTLRGRNRFRGVPDALEVKQRFGSSVVVLSEGNGEIDLSTGEVHQPRVNMYDTAQRDAYLSRYDNVLYPYQLEAQISSIEIARLLETAHLKAVSRLKNLPTRSICFNFGKQEFLCIKSDMPGRVRVTSNVDDLPEYEIIRIDSRYMYGLLTRKYHWNNAEIGSHFSFHRFPETYDHRVYDLLNFLHV